MKLIPVENVPEPRRRKKQLQEIIEGFVFSEAEIAKIEFGDKDYKTPKVAYSCLHVAVKRSKRPIKVVWRDSEIYFIKKVEVNRNDV